MHDDEKAMDELIANPFKVNTRVDDDHAHDQIFKLNFLQQKSCLLNHTQLRRVHYLHEYP